MIKLITAIALWCQSPTPYKNTDQCKRETLAYVLDTKTPRVCFERQYEEIKPWPVFADEKEKRR